MAQLAVPEADITATGYTDQDAGTTDLFAAIDEYPFDDDDFILSPVSPSADPYVCRLAEVDDPVSSDNHIVRYRFGKDDVGGEQIDMTVQLRQGYVSEGAPGTLIREWVHEDISDELEQVSQLLSGAEADSITNYADLYLRVVFDVAA